MKECNIKLIIEAILLSSNQPVTESDMLKTLQTTSTVTANQISQALQQLIADYSDRAFELVSLASGWQILTKEKYAPWIRHFQAEKPQKYSAATMETLAIIAYKQPVTRADIESLRGVSVSSQIIKGLIERHWVKISGYRDTPGKPAMYVTTQQFLDYFKLSSLSSLPKIAGLVEDEAQVEEFYI